MAHEIKTNIPKFFHFDIVIILEVRYVCFDFMGQKMVINPLSLPSLILRCLLQYCRLMSGLWLFILGGMIFMFVGGEIREMVFAVGGAILFSGKYIVMIIIYMNHVSQKGTYLRLIGIKS